MIFKVKRSINNMYILISESGEEVRGQIKGKVLKTCERVYNPIVCGDIVEGDEYSGGIVLITKVLEEKSKVERWNRKRMVNQRLCSNQDVSVIVLSTLSPPFRPRFLDRAICCSFGSDIIIVFNKIDLQREKEAVKLYSSLGFKIIETSALKGDGVSRLKKELKGKTAAFYGQSGAGKSTLINAILSTNQKTGEISKKYNRGSHTTNHALLLNSEDISIIDTPGVRDIDVPFVDPLLLLSSFPEFKNIPCYYSSCLHRGEEGCSVESLIEKKKIKRERYESYLRIVSSIEERKSDGQKNM